MKLNKTAKLYWATMIILSAIAIILFSTQVYFALASTTLTIDKDTVFVKLIENKAGLTSGESIFEIYNPLDIEIDLSKYLGFEFNQVKGKISSFEVYVNYLESYEVPVYGTIIEYKDCVIQNNETGQNETIECNQELKYVDYYETKYREAWKKAGLVGKGKHKVKLIGRWKASTEGISIDWVPRLDLKKDIHGLDQDLVLRNPDWAWWNESWTKKRLLSNLDGDIIYIDLNYTNFTGALTNWSDLRFVDTTETTEYGYVLQKKVDSANATFRIRSFNATSLYIYYNYDTASSTSNISNVYGSDLESAWFLDELSGTNAEDSANGYNGTATNMEDGDWQGSGIKKGADFDGSNEYFTMGDNLDFDNDEPFSFSFWVKYDTEKDWGRLVHKQVKAVPYRGYSIYYNFATDKLYAEFYSTSATNGILIEFTKIISTGTWYHVVWTYSGSSAASGMKLYVNGSEITGGDRNEVYDNLDATTLNAGSFMLASRDAQSDYHDGQMDEIEVYSKELNSTEVGWLYNTQEPIYILGAEEKPAGPIVNLNTPVDDAKLNNSLVTFNGIVYDDGGVVNVSLILDGVYNETNSSGVNDSNYIFTKTISDGEYNWTYESCDNEDLCVTATVRDFSIDTVYPKPTLTAPNGSQGYYIPGKTLNLNWTVVEEHPNICWYDFNKTNTTLTCGDNHITFQTYNNSDTNITFYVNDTYGNLNFTTISWYYEITVEDESYNNITYETERETFQINVTIPTGNTIYAVNLVYNDTGYVVSDIQTFDGTYQLTRVIDIPLNSPPTSNVTNNFYWNFTLVDAEENQGTQIPPSHNQTANYIDLRICNATFYNTTALNFTYMDELLDAKINATTNATSIESTFLYWIGGGSVQKNYSYINLTNSDASQYKFCIYPSNKTIRTDLDLEYEAVDYAPRTYYLRNATLTNVSNDIELLLLQIDYSVKFFFSLKQNMQPFTDAIVTINKYFIGEGVYRTVGIREVDDAGEFIEYLDLDKRYQFVVVRNQTSYGTITKQASCKEAPCIIILELEEAIIDLWQGYYDIFAQNVAYSLTYNDTSGIVTYTFNDLTGLAQYFKLDVVKTKFDEAGELVCNETLYSTAGTLTCNMTAINQTGNFMATAYISRSPSLIVDFLRFVRQTIKDTLGLLGIFVSFCIIVTVALVGAWNPVVGVVLTAFAILMMWILGFAAFSLTTVLLIVILTVILVIKMKA